MLWSDLEVGDVVSFTDEFRDYYKIKSGFLVYDWFSHKLLTIYRTEIEGKYIYLCFRESDYRTLGIYSDTGTFCNDGNSPTVFKIVKLKDE